MRGFDIEKGPILALLLACACAGKSELAATQAGSGAGGGSSAGAPVTNGAGNSAGNGGSGTTIDLGGGPQLDAGDTAQDPRIRCVGPCADGGPRPVPLPRPECPELEPTSGASCTQIGLDCTYGDAPTVPCRREYTCQSGAGASLIWARNTLEQLGHPCTALPDGYCPATAPAQNSACVGSGSETPCLYGTLLCNCENHGNSAGNPGSWSCWGPPADLRCPGLAPNVGEGCASENLECEYALSCFESELMCRAGAWQPGPTLCYD